MTDVLIDVHIVDANLNNVSQQNDSLYKYGIGQYLQVFKSHHIDSAQFRKSFAYYGRNPDQLNEMYDDVLARLKFKVDSVNKVIEKKAKLRLKADSITEVKRKKAELKFKTDSLNKLKQKKNVQASKADSLNKVIQKKANGIPRK